jgi:hypothetical protein
MTTPPSIVCTNCKAVLTEYKRFCPECGARIVEPDAAPTIALPAATPPPSEGESGASAIPPTVRLDSPGARTVLLPPDAPPAAPTVLLPPDLPPAAPTVLLSPEGQPAAPPAPPVAADTATVMSGPPPVLPRHNEPEPTPTPPSPGAQTPPANQGFGQQLPPVEPAYSAGQLPPASVAPPAPPAQRRTLWIILGGVGCLSLVLLGICAVGLLTLLGQRVEPITTVGTSGPTPDSGAGGIVPDDSPLTGGSVLLEDDFEDEDASGLGVDEDSSSRYAYEDGQYVIEVKEPEMIVWARVNGSYDDARISVETEVPPGADVSAPGLIFHYQDANNFYLFSVSNDGYYALELRQGEEWITLIDWTESPAIDAVRNTLRVETAGDDMTLYVNNELLEATSDGTFTDGEVALAVSSLQESTAEIRFDNLLIETNE